jgi:hypothetical protein
MNFPSHRKTLRLYYIVNAVQVNSHFVCVFVYVCVCVIHMKLISTMCVQNAEIFNTVTGDMHSCHSSLNG